MFQVAESHHSSYPKMKANRGQESWAAFDDQSMVEDMSQNDNDHDKEEEEEQQQQQPKEPEWQDEYKNKLQHIIASRRQSMSAVSKPFSQNDRDDDEQDDTPNKASHAQSRGVGGDRRQLTRRTRSRSSLSPLPRPEVSRRAERTPVSARSDRGAARSMSPSRRRNSMPLREKNSPESRSKERSPIGARDRSPMSSGRSPNSAGAAVRSIRTPRRDVAASTSKKPVRRALSMDENEGFFEQLHGSAEFHPQNILPKNKSRLRSSSHGHHHHGHEPSNNGSVELNTKDISPLARHRHRSSSHGHGQGRPLNDGPPLSHLHGSGKISRIRRSKSMDVNDFFFENSRGSMEFDPKETSPAAAAAAARQNPNNSRSHGHRGNPNAASHSKLAASGARSASPHRVARDTPVSTSPKHAKTTRQLQMMNNRKNSFKATGLRRHMEDQKSKIQSTSHDYADEISIDDTVTWTRETKNPKDKEIEKTSPRNNVTNRREHVRRSISEKKLSTSTRSRRKSLSMDTSSPPEDKSQFFNEARTTKAQRTKDPGQDRHKTKHKVEHEDDMDTSLKDLPRSLQKSADDSQENSRTKLAIASFATGGAAVKAPPKTRSKKALTLENSDLSHEELLSAKKNSRSEGSGNDFHNDEVHHHNGHTSSRTKMGSGHMANLRSSGGANSKTAALHGANADLRDTRLKDSSCTTDSSGASSDKPRKPHSRDGAMRASTGTSHDENMPRSPKERSANKESHFRGSTGSSPR